MVLDLAALRGSGGLRREEFEARLAPPDGEPPRVGRVRLLRERVPQQRRPLSRRHPRGGTAPYWGATAGGLPPSSPADGPDSANSASLLRGGRHTPFVPRTGARLPGRAAALRRPGVASWLTSGALRRRGRTSPPSLRLRAPGAVRKLLIWRVERGGRNIFYPRGDGVLPWFGFGSRGLLADFTLRSCLRGNGVLGTLVSRPQMGWRGRRRSMRAGHKRSQDAVPRTRRSQERSREACPAKAPPRTCLGCGRDVAPGRSMRHRARLR